MAQFGIAKDVGRTKLTTILNCLGCNQKLRVPTDRGRCLKLRCPKCSHSWEWSMAAEPLSEVNEERLAEMLLRWEEQNEQGKDVPAEELCREWPELLSILRDRIQALGNLAWLGNHQPCEANRDQRITRPPMRKGGDEALRQAAISPHPEDRFGSCRESIEALRRQSAISPHPEDRWKAKTIRLRGINEDAEGKVWETASVLRAGRLTTLEMPLNHSSVSRRHAEIRWSGADWILRDLESRNGTFLNGTRITAGAEWPIRPHDIIRFGNVSFVVDSPGFARQPIDRPGPSLMSLASDAAEKSPPTKSTERPKPGHCKPLWRIVIPGNRPLATPAIANNKVFVGGGFGSHEFYAFAADTGEQLWRYQTKDDGPTAAITLDDLVAFNTESCELEVLTVEGRPVWKKWLGDPLLTQPAAANGRVFIVYPDSHGDRQHYLGCFDLRTGNLIWRQACGYDAITVPVLAEGNVYLTTQDGTIHRFCQDDGTRVWTKARSATSSPVVWNKACYYSRREASPDLVQYECLSKSHPERACEDFEKTWCRADYLDYARRQSYSQVEALSQTLDAGVGFSSWKGHSSMGMSQANLGHGTVAGVWSYQGSKPFIYRHRLYSCMGRHLECLDPLSGEIIWKTKIVDGDKTLVDHALTPPVTVNGKVIVATVSGELACLCAETGAWLWREIIGEPIAFQPAVANGRVFVASTRGCLHCFETGDPNDDGWLMWGGTPAHNGIEDGPMVVPFNHVIEL